MRLRAEGIPFLQGGEEVNHGVYSSPQSSPVGGLWLSGGIWNDLCIYAGLARDAKRRSSAGMNPRMAAIMGAFQILGVYYGLLIASRLVILWNVVAVLVNSLSVGAYLYFVHREQK
jgi:hypothetical protein